MTITIKQFRAMTWKKVYEYAGKVNHFETYSCEALPGVTITHDFKKGKPTRITYAVGKRRTESPSQLVKWINAIERQEEIRRRQGIADVGNSFKKAEGKQSSLR